MPRSCSSWPVNFYPVFHPVFHGFCILLQHEASKLTEWDLDISCLQKRCRRGSNLEDAGMVTIILTEVLFLRNYVHAGHYVGRTTGALDETMQCQTPADGSPLLLLLLLLMLLKLLMPLLEMALKLLSLKPQLLIVPCSSTDGEWMQFVKLWRNCSSNMSTIAVAIQFPIRSHSIFSMFLSSLKNLY